MDASVSFVLFEDEEEEEARTRLHSFPCRLSFRFERVEERRWCEYEVKEDITLRDEFIVAVVIVISALFFRKQWGCYLKGNKKQKKFPERKTSRNLNIQVHFCQIKRAFTRTRASNTRTRSSCWRDRRRVSFLNFFFFFGLLVSSLLCVFSSNAFDDVEEKKKPQECGSTTNNRTGKEW